jgi:ubiquinol-cytochrome c reductase cytochrome b subunit
MLDWIDERTGLPSAAGQWLRRPVAGGPAWRLVWPSTLVFTLVTQAVTGIALWMYYTPAPRSAWESVYYLQRHVLGGWWLRAIHYYAAQVALVLVGIYLVQMIVRGTYRAPREFLFWTVLLMGLVTLGLNLTGDLLPWDQNGYWATHVRVGFLDLLPGIGSWLWKLAVGGPEFGQLTLTRFFALHVGVFVPVLVILVVVHAWVARRYGLEDDPPQAAETSAAGGKPPKPDYGKIVRLFVCDYWPEQALRDMVACAVVLGIVLILASGCGLELGVPANPAEDPGTARPEWSFRGLYQFRELFPASVEILPIFVFSGLTVLVFFLMPFLGTRPAGRRFNVAFTVVVLGGLGLLSWQSYHRDAGDEKFQRQRAAGQGLAERVEELALAGGGIPPAGAPALLADDPKTQGPRLYEQFCAGCHGAAGSEIAAAEESPRDTTAPTLVGFATREWLGGMLDPKQVGGPRYFGSTKFKKGPMVQFVKEDAPSMEEAELRSVQYAISAEADLPGQRAADKAPADAAKIAAGRALLNARRAPCTDCHTFHGKGTAQGPDLTGYGSRQWLVEFIGNPAHKRFYGKLNDRMAAYAGTPSDPASRILSDREIALLADWLRGEWYEPQER